MYYHANIQCKYRFKGQDSCLIYLEISVWAISIHNSSLTFNKIV